ncbi:uncharacterized protein LOC116298504 [Actinia tenebrosa]|uniref:Uncharacterized protein LOC116298504 n=1 Tax=Actinia tenebrosa TaxID=6105 RepID=A0A6P8I4P6_ACTTE|nr:uncharacterized protein LOC116298504 [Actinia tenebrosa]
MPALVKAINERRFRQARFLVASGYNVNDKDHESGHTALIASCLLENERKACCIIKWLLRHEACLLTSDNRGLTPLMHACKNRKYRVVELILKEKELDLKAQDNEGNSALLYATRSGDLKITKIILREFVRRRVQGQDQANSAGETPLILAAKLGHWECCDVLLKGGKASPHARDFEMKMTAEEWKMSTLHSNALPLGKKSLEGLSRQVRSANGKCHSVEHAKGQDVTADGGDQNSAKNSKQLQSSKPWVYNDSNRYHFSRCNEINHDERSVKLLDKRSRRKGNPMKQRYGDYDETNFEVRSTAASPLGEIKSSNILANEDKGICMRGHTSKGLKSIDVVNGHDRQTFLKSRKDNRSMSAPQRAYESHVGRLRKTYDEKCKNALEKKDVPDWTQPKRQTSFTNDQLPSLLRVLGDQQSSSYRVKATPPPPEPEPDLRKETGDPRRKDILKRFAKAGLASMMMSKLGGVRRKSGATEYTGKINSPLSGHCKRRTRSNSCRSDGSSHSTKSLWI